MSVTTDALRAQQDQTTSGYHQSWFPVALASEVPADRPVGQDFLGTRVVVYRDPAGRPVVQGAYCPHLGADLSVGQVVDGQIRCAYHHWRFDCAGTCVDIPAGDRIPKGARIPTYPTAEAWGLVWAFNGEAPTFPVPGIPGAEERELICEAHFRGTRAVDPWVSISNGVDFQHLRARRRRICHLAREAAQDRRAYRRDRKPHSACAGQRLPTSRAIPMSGRCIATGRTVNKRGRDLRHPLIFQTHEKV